MPRVVKEEEFTARRNEILDSAQRLVYTKGYEQMSIQDILDDLKISKGAFYHYFGSKQALLEALIERLMDEAIRILTPIVEDSTLSALEKLRRYFGVAAQWKAAQKDYLLALLNVWYDDNNAIVRQKVFSEAVKWITPMIATIIRQGVQEGTLATPFPEHAGQIIFTMFQGLSETFIGQLLLAREPLGREPQHLDLQRIEDLFNAYNDALERVLGAAPGSLPVIEMATLKAWLTSPQDSPTQGEPAVAAEARAI